MISSRTKRLADRLFHFIREAAYFDTATKQKYNFMNRHQILEKYTGRDDVFVSFTQLPKLGVNPSSTYNTPSGVYSYPVDYVYSSFFGGRFNVPFMADQKYIHIFQFVNINKCLVFHGGDNTLVEKASVGLGFELGRDRELLEESGVEPVLQKIKQFVDKTTLPLEFESWELFETGERDETKFYDWYDDWIYELYHETGLGNIEDQEICKLIIDRGGIGIDALLDSFWGERRFSVINAKWAVIDYLRQKDMVSPIFPYELKLQNLPEVKMMTEAEYIRFKFKVLSERVVCDRAYVWNAARDLAQENPSKWTGMMRKMGILGAIDYGTSTIHPNEPTQAVFFDPQSVKIFDVLTNINPYRTQEHTTLGMMAEWAVANESQVDKIVNALNTTLFQVWERITRGRKFGVDTDKWNRIQRMIGWLNMHAQGSPYWTIEIKDKIATTLGECKEVLGEYREKDQVYFKLDNIINLTLKMLRRRSNG